MYSTTTVQYIHVSAANYMDHKPCCGLGGVPEVGVEQTIVVSHW